MKPLCSSILILILAAGCSLTADVKPTHQLQWVPAEQAQPIQSEDPQP